MDYAFTEKSLMEPSSKNIGFCEKRIADFLVILATPVAIAIYRLGMYDVRYGDSV